MPKHIRKRMYFEVKQSFPAIYFAKRVQGQRLQRTGITLIRIKKIDLVDFLYIYIFRCLNTL